MSTDIGRIKKKRSANKNVIQGLIVKANDAIAKGAIIEVEGLLKTIKTKEILITELNDEILGLIEEDKIDEDVEEATGFDVKIAGDILVIEKFMEKCSSNEGDRRSGIIEQANSSFSNNPKFGVKLPKIFIKRFTGDPTAWQQFDETFEATVNKNTVLSDVEKFSYLKGYLGGSAEKCIEGLTLSNENYSQALNLLRERYGNPQLVISSHMNKLLKLDKIKMGRNVKELRNLFDQIEGHIRSLRTVEVKSEHYGPLLIPLILERLPDDIKLQISRKLGKENWKIEEFMKILKEEITARESCDFMKTQFEGETDDKGTRHFTTEALFTDTRTLVCAFCKQSHYHDKCTTVTDVAERKEIVRKYRLCFKCLFKGHPIRNCRSKRNCFNCRSSNHHTAICEKYYTQKNFQENKSNDGVTNLVNSSTSVLLQTACGIVSDNYKKRSRAIKILLDSGSQRTYISDRIVKQLKLKPISSQNITVNTFGSVAGKSSILSEYSFCVQNSKRGCNLYMTGFSVPFICSPLTNQRIDIVERIFPILKDLDLSDISGSDREIDMLIGADYYWCIVEGETKRCSDDGLTAINSKLGWLLSGPYQCEDPKSSTVNFASTHTMLIDFDKNENDTLSKQVEMFWDLDVVGIKENEVSAYEKFLDDVKFVNGRYEVRLPFKENHPLIEDNYLLASSRLTRLKRKLDKDIKLLQQYDDVMKNQLKTGIIEEVKTKPVIGEVTYLPHHAVIRGDKKTTKVRVVFDASAKNKGPSLNECLYKGQSLNPLLYDIILRFRVFNVGLSADIEAAYLQISVPVADRDYLRFLWYDDVKRDNPEIIKYRFTRVIFGASCSQFLLNGVLRIHADKYKASDPQFANMVSRQFYVDDLTCSVPSVEDGIELYKKVKLRYLEGNFRVRKWRTNNMELRKFINIQENNDVKTEDVKSQNTGDKVLGIIWRDDTDDLVIDVKSYLNNVNDLIPTKRNVLKFIAAIYDPLGFIQPFTVKLKILFQIICSSKVDWDDDPTEKVKNDWLRIVEEFRTANEVIIPRCYCITDINDPIICTELHGFSDASESAFGACIYLKFVKKSGKVEVTFVTSKSRIVPIKAKHTIPRLELLGNLLLSKLITNVSRALQEEMHIDKIYCWSDSKVSLAWINARNKEFKTFVQNRVIEIRKNVGIENWYYCRSEENPADIITRGNNNPHSVLWFNGPDILRNNGSAPTNDYVHCSVDDPEFVNEITINKVVLHAAMNNSNFVGNIIDIHRYNDLLKLFRITAYVLRFVRNLKSKVKKEPLLLTTYVISSELRDAKLLRVRDNQNCLNDSTYNDLKLNLNLRIDENGVIRSYSRLKNAKIPFDTKAPIFINKNHKLAELIVYYSHLKVMHRGVKQTLTEIRTNYWITRGRNYVKKLLHPCTLCKKLNARPYEYPGHSDLPELRFDDRYPFSSTGVDYLGPLYCQPDQNGENDKFFKAYVVIYTCASTRAVILEVVPDANAGSFINSFTRFISRRGCPNTIVSDNGSIFKADETQSFAGNRYINWKFNLEKAPWWGGMWERLVASVKRCLKKVVGVKTITYTELQTLILEIEVILNNRPICADYDDDQEDVLTPNHLVFGRRLETSSNASDVEISSCDDVNMNKRKRFIDTMLDHFWGRWRKEYVTSLRENQRYTSVKRSAKIQLNDVVIIYDEKQPRHLWRIGKVEKLIIGTDGKIRGAEIKSGKTGVIVRRPVNKLYPLVPNSCRIENINPIDVSTNTEHRPKRNAAISGELRRKFGNVD